MKTLAMAALVAIGCPAIVCAQRRPLFVEPLTSLAHQPTTTRLRFDAVARKYVEYSVEGKIDYLSETGNFLLSWNGRDGSRQRLTVEPTNKVVAVIAAEVTFDVRTHLYTYAYTFSNLTRSPQRLRTVYLGAKGMEGATGPDGWYSRRLTPYLQKQLSLDDGWAWSLTNNGKGIPPGESVSGFRLTSAQPPGVVRVFAEGYRPSLETTEDLPEQLHAAIDSVYFRLPIGYTIGPTAPSTNADATAELDMIRKLVADAAGQGWVEMAVAEKVQRSLGDVRSSIGGRAGVPSASNGIADLLKEVRGTEFKGMLSEARALLEYRLPILEERIARARRQ